MHCGGCGFDNPAGMRFCGRCGGSLASACVGCGFQNPDGFAFCGQCGRSLGGADAVPEAPAAASASTPERAPRDYTPAHLAERILTSRSALEGERKQVTVLFADLQGSMELARSLGAERWHEVLDGFFQILTEGVHRFEGTVNQYTGDGIMALFGAPLAHEDHAQRACYAAIWLRDRLRTWADGLRVRYGVSVAARMGLNSGEVVVGRIGDDLRMDYTAQGHTVGLAQRMEALADPGGALLASRTIELVDGFFELREIGDVQVKGVDAPVRVAELLGPGRMRTRLDRSRARGLSRFVGRDPEIEQLDAALERALEGDGQVFGFVAEAGAGKSRLCHEFAERCRARGITVRSGTGVPHGRALPLEPVLEFYREIFGIAPEDGDAEARQKIAGLIAQIAPEEIDRLPLVYEFMHVPEAGQPAADSPAERHAATFDLIRRLTLARSRRQASVLIFEDLHWLDPESERVIEILVDATAGTRTLFLVNFRPEYRPTWMGRTHFTQVALRPLDAKAAGELLADWLGPDPSLAGFSDRVRDKTGGNPFFMEEVVQSQIEAGALVGTRGRFRLERAVDTIEVPETVQSLLSARIDRLDEAHKRLLQAVAVIGDEATESLIERVIDESGDTLRPALRTLVQAEFLYEQALYPEIELAFKHPLTREVAYGSLLGDRRRALHVRVAEALQKHASGNAPPSGALIAHHYEVGGRALEAARWHARVGRELGMGRIAELLFHWRKVADLAQAAGGGEEPASLLAEAWPNVLYAAARSLVPEAELNAIFESARRSLPDGDSGDRASLLSALALSRYGAGQRLAALEAAREAAAIARRLDDRELLLQCLVLEMLACNQDEPMALMSAWQEAERSAPEAPATPDAARGLLSDAMGWGLALAAFILPEAGRVREGEALLRRLRERPDPQDDPVRSIVRRLPMIRQLLRTGDADAALELARASIELSRGTGNRVSETTAHGNLGRTLLDLGRPEDAIGEFEAAVAAGVDSGGAVLNGLHALAGLAEAHALCGRTDLARETATRGLDLASRSSSFGAMDRCRIVLATCAQREGKLAEARARLDEAEASARERGHVLVEALAARRRADLAAAEQDAPARAAALADAARRFRLCGEERLAREAESVAD